MLRLHACLLVEAALRVSSFAVDLCAGPAPKTATRHPTLRKSEDQAARSALTDFIMRRAAYVADDLPGRLWPQQLLEY